MEDELAGIKDAESKVIIKPAYAQIEDFSEGLAAVNLGGEWADDLFGPTPEGGNLFPAGCPLRFYGECRIALWVDNGGIFQIKKPPNRKVFINT